MTSCHFVPNLLQYMRANNCFSTKRFDIVIVEIKRCSFFLRSVVTEREITDCCGVYSWRRATPVVLWCAVRTITGSCMESSAGAQPRDAPSRTDLQSTLERRHTSNGSPKRSRKTRTRIPLLNSLELDHVVRYRLSINSSVCIVASECAFFYFDPSLFTRRLPTMAVRGELFPNIPISDTFRVHRFLIDADLFYIVFFLFYLASITRF